MNIDDIIDLENGKSYLLLLNSEIDKSNYFLAVLLNELDEPTNEYIVLKEINENGEIFTQKVNDPIILSKLIENYSLDYQDDYQDAA